MYLFIYIWILYLWAPHIQNGLKVGPILEKTLILFHTQSPHTKQKPQLIIHRDKRRLSPIDTSVPQFSLASSSSSSKHRKIKTKPLKTKSASKPCHQDQLLRPPSPRPCSRPQPPTSPRRLLNPRSPITHSMLHSFSGSFCFLGFEFCVCVS